jgi:putative SOS response-associated peptidase YedK
MCGRFTISIAVGFYDRFQVEKGDVELVSRYNIAPTQEIPVILPGEQGAKNELAAMRWGLVPSWDKGPDKGGHHPINARSEGLLDSPMFRPLIQGQRCLIPASGFFEWKSQRKEKIPYYIHRKDDDWMAFAGLYDLWTREDKVLFSCTIVTTWPNSVVAPLHNRMPAILLRKDESQWLYALSIKQEDLDRMLSPYPSEELESYQVSQMVNKPNVDHPEIIHPVQETLE